MASKFLHLICFSGEWMECESRGPAIRADGHALFPLVAYVGMDAPEWKGYLRSYVCDESECEFTRQNGMLECKFTRQNGMFECKFTRQNGMFDAHMYAMQRAAESGGRLWHHHYTTCCMNGLRMCHV